MKQQYLRKQSEYMETLGLYNGQMGQALCLFKQYRLNKDRTVLKEAKNTLNGIAKNIGGVTSYCFADGLMGIGWGIEWIAQNKYLKINTNEVLWDLDDEVYRLVIFSRAESQDLKTGTLARALYLYKRITAINKEVNFYRETVLLECLVLCIDELYESLMPANENGIRQLIPITTKNAKLLAQALVLTCKLSPLNLDHQVSILHDAIVAAVLAKTALVDTGLGKGQDYLLLNSLYVASLQFQHEVWFKLSKERLKLLGIGLAVPFPKNKNPIFNMLQKLSGYTKDYSWQEAWLLR